LNVASEQCHGFHGQLTQLPRMLAGFFAPPTQGGRFAASWLSSPKDRAALVRFGAPGVSRSGARISSHPQLLAASWIPGLLLSRLLERRLMACGTQGSALQAPAFHVQRL
jgi:hypothetical protein